MNTSSWDDAKIHAYVDGELDADAAARLESDSRSDAALAARIAQQRELKALLRGAFDPVLNEPVPQRLRDALTGPAPGATVTPIGAARKEPARARPVWSLREWSAMAATLVFGALLGPLLLRGPAGLPVKTTDGQLVAATYLDEALSAQLSGAAPAGAGVSVSLSFRAANGQFCRGFTLQTGASGLACRRDGHWAVQLLEGGSASPRPDSFRQASSALSPALLRAAEALGAGDALTRDEEQQHLGSGWDAAGP
jgi:hypothetical protein